MKRYTESHEWVDLDGDVATVGITDHIQRELGEIVYVELPKKKFRVSSGDVVVVIESTKAAIDIYSPISGEICDVNVALVSNPEKINNSAEGDGWLFKVKVGPQERLEGMLDEKSYSEFIVD